MRSVEIQMDWRHFARVYLSVVVVALCLSGVVLVRTGFNGLRCFILVFSSFLFSVVVAAGFSGLHAVRKEWQSGNIYPSDFILPFLAILGIAAWFATGLIHENLPGLIELGFLIVAIVWCTVEWIARRRRRRTKDCTLSTEGAPSVEK